MEDMLVIPKEKAVSLYGSQAELARAFGVTKAVVCRWPTGEPIPEYYALKLRYVLKPEAFTSPAPAIPQAPKPTVPPASKIDAANLRKARRLARELLDLCSDET